MRASGWQIGKVRVVALHPLLEELQELENLPQEWCSCGLPFDLDLAAVRGHELLGSEKALRARWPVSLPPWERLAGLLCWVCIQPAASVSLGIHTTLSSSGS